MCPREDTPLLSGSSPSHPKTTTNESIDVVICNDDNNEPEDVHEERGDATVGQTMVTMAKACLGPGCLTIPFAARQGGLVLHTIGLLFMATWNVYVIQRLCQCLQYLPSSSSPTTNANANDDEEADLEEEKSLYHQKHHTNSTTTTMAEGDARQRQQQQQQQQQHPPEGTAVYGKVMFYATGPKGLWFLDVLMLNFLLGILITYINAMRSFLWDTPFSTHNDVLDALLLVAIMGPLSSVPHFGYLSKASAMGLIVLAMSFLVFLFYGIQQSQFTPPSTTTESTTPFSLSWYPKNGLYGVSHWFGCVVFSFGVAPLTYNFRSSMADPTKMVYPAASWTLTLVAIANMIVGIGFWLLFPMIDGDLIQELPTDHNQILPILTRLAMVLVVLTTTPLLIAPCGELLEGKATNLNLTTTNNTNNPVLSPQTRRILFRVGISLIGVSISLYVPGFVDVLSFVGCCCVALLGFTMPPFLHGMLRYQQEQRNQKKKKILQNNDSNSCTTQHGELQQQPPATKTSSQQEQRWYKMDLVLDIIMFAWGVFATVVSTTYTFRQLISGS